VDVAATHHSQNGQIALFMLNRDLESERELVLEFREPTPSRVLHCETLTGTDLKAANTFEQPKRVVPQTLPAPNVGARMSFKLPARSYSIVHFSAA
jgi:alpha-N-arabinofuranosidase